MRRWHLGMLAAANAIISASLGVISNAASESLPLVLIKHPGWIWTLVGVFALAAVACAIPLVLGAISPREPEPPIQRWNGGLNAGRDLNITGKGHTVAGGDIIGTGVPPRPSSEAHSKGRHH
jgi:hypothetical protein